MKYLVSFVATLALALVILTPVYASAQSSINVQSIPGPSVAEKIREQTQESWPWYLSRGSGLLAAAALVVLMLSGIGQITGHTFRFLEPLTAWASHRALGLVFGGTILVHMFSLMFDKFVKFSFLDVLIPFYSDFKSVSIAGVSWRSLYLALGIIALYLSIAIVITSILWINKHKRLWKVTHILSYIVMAIVFMHALMLGTDLSRGVIRLLWVLSAMVVAIASIVRARRAYTAK